MKYTDSHEWIKIEEENIARIGITEYAQKELGDIVYVELPTLKREVKAKEEAAVLESTKAAADLYSPVSGMIWEVNEQLNEHPEWINQSPEKDGWIYRIKLSDLSEIEQLMDQEQYQALLNG